MTDFSDTEIETGGWTRIGRNGRAEKKSVRAVGDDEQEEYTWLSLPRRMAFPPVASLIAFSAPEPTEPLPLDDATTKRHTQALKEIEEVRTAVGAAIIRSKKTEKELGDIKAASSSVNKWSSTHKTAAQTIERLSKQLAAENAEVEQLKKQMDKCAAAWKITLDYVASHKKCEENWKEYTELRAQHKELETQQEAELARDLARALRKAAVVAAETRKNMRAPEPWELALAATTLY